MASVRARGRARGCAWGRAWVPTVTVAAEFEQADCWTTPRRQKTRAEHTSGLVSGSMKE